MTSARTSVATESVHAFEHTDLGVERSGEVGKPVDGSGYRLTSHVGAGLPLKAGGGVDPALLWTDVTIDDFPVVEPSRTRQFQWKQRVERSVIRLGWRDVVHTASDCAEFF